MKVFVGREKVLEDARKNIFVTELDEDTQGYSCSIMGLNGIGKTSLVEHWAKRWKEENKNPNIYYFGTSLAKEEVKDAWTFWVDLIGLIKEDITKEKLEAAPNAKAEWVEEVLKIFQNLKTSADYWAEPNEELRNMNRAECVTKFFRMLDKLGIYLIISIDEFDNALTLFPKEDEKDNGAFFRRLFSLSAKASCCNRSILLISRRHVGTIAHGMPEGSSFVDAYEPYALSGLEYQEAIQYLCKLKNYRRLKDDDFARIVGYCGTHPGLLNKLGTSIDAVGAGEELDINTVFVKNAAKIHPVFQRMHDLMKNEYVDTGRMKKCVGAFKQSFLGPVYDEDSLIKTYLETMRNHGYVIKREKSEKNEPVNVFELAGYTEKQYEGYRENSFAEQQDYEPISPYFVYYMKYNILPEELDEFDKVRSYTEQNVRDLIVDVYKEMYGDSWAERLEYSDNVSDEINDIFKEKKSYRTNLDIVALANGRSTDEYTSLITLSFREYAKIILKHWNEMKQYFQSYTEDDLKDDFYYMYVTRNTIAHENRKLLNEEYYRIAQEVCDRINRNIEDGRKGITLRSLPEPAYAVKFSGWDRLKDANAYRDLVGTTSGSTRRQQASGNGQRNAGTLNIRWATCDANTYNGFVSAHRYRETQEVFAFTCNRIDDTQIVNSRSFTCATGTIVVNGLRYNVKIDNDKAGYENLSVGNTSDIEIISQVETSRGYFYLVGKPHITVN